MLLLDPGEILFEDYSVSMKILEPDESEWLDGRLKLCSKSLVFVSGDVHQPLMKIQFKDTTLANKASSNELRPRYMQFRHAFIMIICNIHLNLKYCNFA